MIMKFMKLALFTQFITFSLGEKCKHHYASNEAQNNLEDGFPSKALYEEQTSALFRLIKVEKMEADLVQLTSFHNRYYRSPTGIEASEWLQKKIKEIIQSQNVTMDAYASDLFRENTFVNRKRTLAYAHQSFPQESIIVKIPGTDPVLAKEHVILGAHLDSINNTNPMYGRAPGADDDGTGVVTLLDILKIVVESKFQSKRTIELHLYAAEEPGHYGSKDIAKQYREAKSNVKSMMQLDMTGYKDSKQINLVNNPYYPGLTRFIEMPSKYLTLGITRSRCAGGCSDNLSWHRGEYTTAFPFEENYNPKLHTQNDTLDLVDFERVKELSKLSLAYLVEISQPSYAK